MSLAKSILFCSALLAFVADASAVVMNWSYVGNSGNAADQSFNGDPAFGAVGYTYNIGTYDVTVSQYAEFLNTKNPTGVDFLGLFPGNLNAPFEGIRYVDNAPSGSHYTVAFGFANFPANYVTWYDAIRFANWMNNGQGNGDTETGAYTLGALDGNGHPLNPPLTHNPGAKIWLPTENEWYKAAYNIPGTNSYFQYPSNNGLNMAPSYPTNVPNSANYGALFGPGRPTDVGAYSGSPSLYGAFDMGVTRIPLGRRAPV